MDKDEALRLALEALESVLANHKGAPVLPWIEARDAIKAALEAKGKPVAWGVFEDGNIHDAFTTKEETDHMAYLKGTHAEVRPLYTQSQRTWVGLTDEDRFEFAKAQHGWEDLLIAAETKLKEKNT